MIRRKYITFWLTIAILMGSLAVLEVTLRMAVVQNHLPAPGRDLGYRRLEEQYAGLERLPHVDCIFIGSSVAQFGLDPQIFAEAYAAQTGRTITCYNFGMWWARAGSEAVMARTLIQQFQPDLLIWGLIPRDLEPVIEQQNEVELVTALPQTDWIRYTAGDFSLRGWLLQHSAAFRYTSALSDALRETRTPYFENVESRIVMGYQPAVYSQANAPANMPPAAPAATNSYRASTEQVEAVRNITQMDGLPTRVILLEMPLHANAINTSFGSINDYRIAYHEALRHTTTDTEAFLWATDHLIFEDGDFVDSFHLWVSGAARFSEWLGRQVGAAHEEGLLGPTPPDDLRFNPPLDDPLPPLRYAENHPLPPGISGSIFDPQQRPPAYPSPGQQIGLMLLWATHVDEKPLSEGDRRHLLDFLAVLNRSQREADLNPVPASLADWRVTMEAGLLAEAGFDHVLIGSDWVDGLSPSQRARLDDPSHYEVIDRWWHPVEEQAYTLYRIVG